MDTLGALALATEPPTYEATTCWTEVGNLGLFFTLETLSVKISIRVLFFSKYQSSSFL
jgi:hypothetical protein